MKNKELASYSGNLVGMICTAVQTEEMLQVISLVITIIATIFSISFTIYNWYKTASKDGRITKDEVEDLKNQIENNLKEDKKK